MVYSVMSVAAFTQRSMRGMAHMAVAGEDEEDGRLEETRSCCSLLSAV